MRILSVPPAISFARATVGGLKDDFVRCVARTVDVTRAMGDRAHEPGPRQWKRA